MKGGCFELNRPFHKTQCDDTVRNVRGVLFVMSEDRERILGSGRAVWIGSRAERGISDGASVHEQPRSVAELKLVARGDFDAPVGPDDWDRVR